MYTRYMQTPTSYTDLPHTPLQSIAPTHALGVRHAANKAF